MKYLNLSYDLDLDVELEIYRFELFCDFHSNLLRNIFFM